MMTFAQLGYWKVGGPMERFEAVDTLPRLCELVAGEPRLFVLGNGSNLLVSDAGLTGTTIRLGGAFRTAEATTLAGAVELHVGAGMPNAVLLNRYLGKLAGLAPLVGVPGTVGGAVAMNAGTALGELGDVLIAVSGVDRDGRTARIERADLPMAYREGGLPAGFVVTSAILRLTAEGAEAELQNAQEHLRRRKATQPLDLPSCGSVFRNPPPDGQGLRRAAGQLIEAAGLKGWRHGGARISEKHANFIVNGGDATANDVMMCIRGAYTAVYESSGVRLTPEVHVVGDWDKNLWPLPSFQE